jgi:hypothetical protein
VVGIFLLKDIDIALSPRDVNALVVDVVIQIVHVGDTRLRRHDLTGIGVIDDQSRRGPGNDEQPMIRLIQSHREVLLELVRQFPFRELLSGAVDDPNLLEILQIDEDV